MTKDIVKLVEYRFAQADETLAVAEELYKKKYYRDAVNRAYYAMFYCGLGMLASREMGSSKHSGVLSLFSRHFIKTGTFSIEAGRFLREAFDLRQKCDYREFVEIESVQVEEMISHAEKFIDEASRVWKRIHDGND